jgi:hypothetical protein
MQFLPYCRCFIINIVINILIISIMTVPITYAKPQPIVSGTHQVQSIQSQPSDHVQSKHFIAKVEVVDIGGFGEYRYNIRKKKWYGHQIIITELLDFIYFVPYFISAPVVHLLNGQPTNALYSLGVRVGFPLVGALAGVGIAQSRNTSNSGDSYDNGGENWSFIIIPLALALLSAIAAVIYDVTVIAYKDVFVSKQALIRPTIGEPSTNVFGLGQAPIFKLNFSF